MSFLVVQAYLKLIGFEFCLKRRNFSALYDKVRNYPLLIQRLLYLSRAELCISGGYNPSS